GSRLYWSVPKGCASDGCWFLRPTMSGCAVGEYGASCCAKIATRQSTTMRVSDHQNALVMRRREGGAAESGTAVTADATPEAASRSAGAETWVGGCIEQIGEEAPQRHHDPADDHRASDQIVIASGDGVGGDVPHARPTEDLLHEEGAADKRRQRQTQKGDHRQQRVAQGMLEHDRTLAQPLRARRAHE